MKLYTGFTPAASGRHFYCVFREGMVFMTRYAEAMERRVSVRTFKEGPLKAARIKEIEEVLRNNAEELERADIQIVLVDLSGMDFEKIKGSGTYGVIKNGRYFLVASIRKDASGLFQLGRHMERILLELSGLGYGTCWLGGTFKRKQFEQALNLPESRFIPVMAAVGEAAEKESWRESLMRSVVGARKRKPWGEIFSDSTFGTPFAESGEDPLHKILKAVHMAPSASNKQPWRLLADKNHLHLFIKRDEKYDRIYKSHFIQDIDMGIAAAHIELASKELGMAGEWVKMEIRESRYEYVLTWRFQ